MRTGKGYLFRAYCSKRVSHQHLRFGRDSKAGRGVGKLYIVEEKCKASNVP